GQDAVQPLRVLRTEVDLVLDTLEAEPHGLDLVRLDILARQVIDPTVDNNLSHCSFLSVVGYQWRGHPGIEPGQGFPWATRRALLSKLGLPQSSSSQRSPASSGSKSRGGGDPGTLYPGYRELISA